MKNLVEIRPGTGGERLFIAGVELPGWFGVDHKKRLQELKEILNEALEGAFQRSRANWNDPPSASDAWKRMVYVCGDCNHTERIWNARPHVTPLGGVACGECGGDMTHTHFGSDEYTPDHRPAKGELLFIDLPPELALIYAGRRVTNALAAGFALPGGKTENDYIRELALEFLGEFGGHPPTAVRLRR